MKQELTFPRVSFFFGQELRLADFEFEKVLGKGSFGQVGLYRHRTSGKEYAIKKIQLNKTQKITRGELEAMTKKEIEILYKLDNEHIIKLLDHFEDENSVYLITEFIEGVPGEGHRPTSTRSH
jgi:serine/threonine protein kinase